MRQFIFRYLRLLSWYWEARLWYRLAVLLSGFLPFLWLVVGLFMAMSFFSAALVVGLWGLVGGVFALGAGALFWLFGGVLGWYWGRYQLRRIFSVSEALMRMRMAQAGLQVMEAQTARPQSSQAFSFLRWVLPLGLRWLWPLFKRLFRQWLG